MPNLSPATNVTFGGFAGAIAVIVIHLCRSNGIVIDDDVAAALPYVIGVGVSYLHDCATGQGAVKISSAEQKNP